MLIQVVEPAVERTIPKRFSTDEVSIVWSAGTSTRNNECSGRKGMLAGVWWARSE